MLSSNRNVTLVVSLLDRGEHRANPHTQPDRLECRPDRRGNRVDRSAQESLPVVTGNVQVGT